MTRVDILCAGKIREKFFRDAIAEYEKRLSHYIKLSILEVQDGPDKIQEGIRMIQRIKGEPYIITLEIEGEELSSTGLSEMIAGLENKGESHIMFVIGGPDGLDASLLDRADHRLSFSKMTFPHPLMRVILLEQIYRAYRIKNNEPYHK